MHPRMTVPCRDQPILVIRTGFGDANTAARAKRKGDPKRRDLCAHLIVRPNNPLCFLSDIIVLSLSKGAQQTK